MRKKRSQDTRDAQDARDAQGTARPSSTAHAFNREEDAPSYSIEHATGILLALAGMALQWAALHSITFFDTVMRTDGLPGSEITWMLNSLCTFSVFFALFVASRRLSSLLEDKRTLPFATICLALGTICFLMGSAWQPLSPLLFAGNVFIACGTTPLIVAWGEVYKYLNPRSEQPLVTLAAIVCSVAIYFTEINLPAALSAFVFAALPFGSLACLVHSHKLLARYSSVWKAKERLPMEKSPALFFVCIVAFSIPYNYLRSSQPVQTVLANATEWSSVLAIVIVIMISASLAEQIAERRGVLLVPSIVLFLLSTAMAVNFLNDPAPLMVPSFLYAGYYLFLAMMYLALGPLVATTDVNPIRLFSSAMLANVGGLLLGFLLGGIVAWQGELVASLAAMLATYVIFFAGFTLLYSRSYSIFRINSYDEEKYSFEYLAPVPMDFAPAQSTRQEAPSNGTNPTNPADSKNSGNANETIASDVAVPLLDAIQTQCNVARESYGLSAREYEVLTLLTRGRTIASIAEALCVSENTAKAHTKAIYRKLEVHTREELLMRVQSLPI